MHASASTLARAPSAIRRLALTTKQTNAGFYKGNRTGTIGWHTKYGGFRIDWLRVRTYVVPEGLDKFDLSPYVTKKLKPTRGRYLPGDHPISGAVYLQQWKEKNGSS